MKLKICIFIETIVIELKTINCCALSMYGKNTRKGRRSLILIWRNFMFRVYWFPRLKLKSLFNKHFQVVPSFSGQN